uniref:putative white-brown complex homolog protein 30 n=1 Tax=Fragaria vesca subsp. vesca TaxID=101020 RepID=UPI0005CA3310|nr:PREDICTED: putative white-brown complex homolog protein 30 [Fragaria vesca subsp. vesca]
MSSLAYFLAKDTVDHFNTVIKPLVYLSIFYFFINARSSLADNYIALLFLLYCVTGIAYASAIFFDQVISPSCCFDSYSNPASDCDSLKILAILCNPKWALVAFVIANPERYSGVWLITRCGRLLKNGYDLHDWKFCITVLIITGLVSRVIAFFSMLIFQKK